MATPFLNTLVCNIKDGMNDWVRDIIAVALTAAAIGAAVHSADSALRIADKEWKLAKKYWHIANNWLTYYQDSYAPIEDRELDEAKKLKGESPEYEVARGRAKAIAWKQFKGAAQRAVRCTSKYCTGRRQELLENLAVAQANALSVCDALGYRNERAYIESRDDVRFSRQFETIKRGRNMVADAHTFGQAAAGIYGKLGDQYWDGLLSSGKFLGYALNRANTEYPTINMHRQYGDPIPAAQAAISDDERNAGEQLLRQP